MRKTVRLSVSVPIEDLIDTVVNNLSFDETIELIKQLDAACEDWGVTEQLYKHFSAEMDKLCEE